MPDGLTPDLAPRLVLAIGGVGAALVILVLVLIFLKRRNSPLFIKGGKSREPRLLVLDAAAVDPKRRLVLIRRDEVEHLIMIGGPTDIVIESGITDRARPATTVGTAPIDDVAMPRTVPVQTPESRPAPPVAERRPEPARPVAAIQPEKSPPQATAPVEARVAQPAIPPVTRSAAPPASMPEKTAPASERLVERAQVERAQFEPRPLEKGVSAMGAMLYGDDREPTTSGKPMQAATAATSPAVPVQPIRAEAAEARAQPVASAAEAALDAARSRVLPGPQAAFPAQQLTVADAERALAARLDTARTDTMRRVQSALPTPPPPAQPMARSATEDQNAQTEAERARDGEPSDFEKLLEAELDASGVFGQPPQIRGDSRVTNAVAAGSVVPPVRVTPPITGATPDVSSEEEVARLLGEIAINRKP